MYCHIIMTNINASFNYRWQHYFTAKYCIALLTGPNFQQGLWRKQRCASLEKFYITELISLSEEANGRSRACPAVLLAFLFISSLTVFVESFCGILKAQVSFPPAYDGPLQPLIPMAGSFCQVSLMLTWTKRDAHFQLTCQTSTPNKRTLFERDWLRSKQAATGQSATDSISDSAGPVRYDSVRYRAGQRRSHMVSHQWCTSPQEVLLGANEKYRAAERLFSPLIY